MGHRSFVAAFIFILAANTDVLSGADTGAAAAHLLGRPESTPTLENAEEIQRVRIPVFMQAWNTVSSKALDGTQKSAKIAAKPLNHILRARMERPNDFYLGDWRIQTTPIRWLKSSNQYQVRLEIFRRYGEAGQVEESLGTMNLSGVLQKQGDGLYTIQGSTRRRFNDQQSQPVLDIEAGNPANNIEKAPLVSKNMTQPN